MTNSHDIIKHSIQIAQGLSLAPIHPIDRSPVSSDHADRFLHDLAM